VGARTLAQLRTAGPAFDVVQAFPATGGLEAESLADTRGRALDWLASPSRLVTIADFETLASSTPGVRVARVKAVPGHHPDFPCVRVAGVVTVVVMPACGTPPIAQPGFRAEVARHLEPLRPLTTEVHVVGPDYVEVGVDAVLHLDTRAEQTAVASAARQAIDDYLDPLHGGPDHTGWPFGRSVYESELLALLAAVPGVLFAGGLTITANSACCGELGLCPTALVKSGQHNLTTQGGFR
jgi:predicted phage baseplate assembly protein